MHYLIYQTVNVITGKTYLGKHQTEDLEDNYLGSGILLREDIKKYGREIFKRTILHNCKNEKEMNELEINLISHILGNPNYYNIAYGGQGGNIVLHSGHPLFEQTKTKLKNAAMDRSDRQSNIAKRQHALSREEYSSGNKVTIGMYGKSQSDHQKSVISKLHKGKVVSEDTKKRLSSAKTGVPNYKLRGVPRGIDTINKIRETVLANGTQRGENNGMHGKHHSDETRLMLSEKAKNRERVICIHCNISAQPGTYNRWHGNKCKKKDNYETDKAIQTSPN